MLEAIWHCMQPSQNGRRLKEIRSLGGQAGIEAWHCSVDECKNDKITQIMDKD